MLGIRTAPKEDLQASSAELVYGQPLRVPGDFVPSATTPWPATLQRSSLLDNAWLFTPLPTSCHSLPSSHVPSGLQSAGFVFIRVDGHHGPLRPPYEGPFHVVKTGDKHFVVDIGGKPECISVDLKPAHLDLAGPVELAQPPKRGWPLIRPPLPVPPAPRPGRRGAPRTATEGTVPPSPIWQSQSSDVFRLVGKSVHLDIQHPVPEFDDLYWIFNKTENVIKYTYSKNIKKFPAYVDRVEFNKETYNLTLKNLQKTDSGLYEAEATGGKVITVVNYTLSVLDPVDLPQIQIHQLSRGTCNITLTCRGHDLTINSSCYNETCEEKEVKSPGGIALSLSVSGSIIICNHSNPVSWRNITLDMRKTCAEKGAASPSAGASVCLLKTVLYPIILILILSSSL
ncbi:hypothetical protein SRHO_G00238380 [Serrasalmus rhombeus]